MRQAIKFALFVMLLAALPLRGHAGVLTALCEGHHGGATVAHEIAQGYGSSHHDDSGYGGEVPAHAASVCSICASCCAGASLAPDAPNAMPPQSPASGRITFLDRRSSGFVPEQLDRPPLSR